MEDLDLLYAEYEKLAVFPTFNQRQRKYFQYYLDHPEAVEVDALRWHRTSMRLQYVSLGTLVLSVFGGMLLFGPQIAVYLLIACMLPNSCAMVWHQLNRGYTAWHIRLQARQGQPVLEVAETTAGVDVWIRDEQYDYDRKTFSADDMVAALEYQAELNEKIETAYIDHLQRSLQETLQPALYAAPTTYLPPAIPSENTALAQLLRSQHAR